MKNRVLWKMLLLSVVTIGIYRIYWFVKTRREMMDLNPNIKILTPAFLIVPVVVLVVAFGVLIASVIGAPDTSNNCSPNSSLYSTSASDNCGPSGREIAGILSFYGGVFIAYVLFIVWEWSYAHGVEEITGGKLSFAMGLIVLILVPDGIDILIIQDSFNKLGRPGIGSPPQFQPAGPPPTQNFAQQFQPQPPQPQPHPNPHHDHHGEHHGHHDHHDHDGGNPPHQPSA
jgi:hypothetical protein